MPTWNGEGQKLLVIIENTLMKFIDTEGAINYRGPETGQYGLILALMAILRYSGDQNLLLKYPENYTRHKLLTDLHERISSCQATRLVMA